MGENVREMIDRVRKQSLRLAEGYLRFGEAVMLDWWEDVRMIVAILNGVARENMSTKEREEVAQVVRQVTFYELCSDNWLHQHVEDFLARLYDNLDFAATAE